MMNGFVELRQDELYVVDGGKVSPRRRRQIEGGICCAVAVAGMFVSAPVFVLVASGVAAGYYAAQVVYGK